MTNSQWPGGTPPQDNSPWRQQDPSWGGPQFTDRQGRDPHQPFGATNHNQQTPTIHDFQEDPRERAGGRRTIVLVAVVVAVVAALVIGLNMFGQTAGPEPGESVGPNITFDPTAAATSGTVIPFEGNGTGTFELLDHSRSGDILEVSYRITLDEGRANFSLYMFSNESMVSYSPVEAVYDDVQAGTPFESTARFRIEPGAATLVLTSGAGHALTALPVPA